MSVLEFLLRLAATVVPAIKRKRDEDEAAREEPLIDEEKERRRAEAVARARRYHIRRIK
jgi:hypothetical protein